MELNWQEHYNNITLDCSLDIAFHPSNGKTILLIIPGVDGSIDGYMDKYKTIAETAAQNYGVAAVRMSNPFISGSFWESNLRHALAWIEENCRAISDHNYDEVKIFIMAHSAGAAVAAKIAHEYPNISKILLVNLASLLDIDGQIAGIKKFGADKTIVVFGAEDENRQAYKDLLTPDIKTAVIDGQDHDFAGEGGLEMFISLPFQYLFD